MIRVGATETVFAMAVQAPGQETAGEARAGAWPRLHRRMTMQKTIAGLAILLFTTFVSYAGADDREQNAMARVHLTTEASLAAGCTPVGAVHDHSVKDLRQKIVKAGGNTGVLSFRNDDMASLYAEAFRCRRSAESAPPYVPAPLPGYPPPPPPR
jgi:hypothetical protein